MVAGQLGVWLKRICNSEIDQLPDFDLLHVGNMDRAILFNDPTVRILFRTPDGLLHHADTFDDDLFAFGMNFEHLALFTLMVTGDHLDEVVRFHMCLDAGHGVVGLILMS